MNDSVVVLLCYKPQFRLRSKKAGVGVAYYYTLSSQCQRRYFAAITSRTILITFYNM